MTDYLQGVLGTVGRLLRMKSEDYFPAENEASGDTTSYADTDMGNDDKMRIMRDVHRHSIITEWRLLAAIADRLLFIVYLLVVLVYTTCILS